jgi:uncharacterized protein YpbB
MTNIVIVDKSGSLKENNVKIVKLDSSNYKLTDSDDEKKINKIPTNKISFEMFIDGKSIEEIATIRNICVNTVYEHITLNLPHENIGFDRFMSEAEYNEIKDICILFGKDTFLKTIKERMNNNISYEKIKVVKKILFG